MPNPNAPFGFQPSTTMGKQNQVTVYFKTSAIIYAGDVVKLNSSGQVLPASAGDVMIGVAAEYANAAATKVAVYDDPNMFFEAQVSADYQLTDTGSNANIVATTGDTALLRSKNAIDSSTFATTNTLQFKVLGLIPNGINAVGSYAVVKVKPNQHFFASGVAGI